MQLILLLLSLLLLTGCDFFDAMERGAGFQAGKAAFKGAWDWTTSWWREPSKGDQCEEYCLEHDRIFMGYDPTNRSCTCKCTDMITGHQCFKEATS